jgi:hypothetical protein
MNRRPAPSYGRKDIRKCRRHLKARENPNKSDRNTGLSVAEGNCVKEMKGGEQPETNDPYKEYLVRLRGTAGNVPYDPLDLAEIRVFHKDHFLVGHSS